MQREEGDEGCAVHSIEYATRIELNSERDILTAVLGVYSNDSMHNVQHVYKDSVATIECSACFVHTCCACATIIYHPV
jgi:hypothetical protein